MRQMRNVVGDHGIFLIYENASPDGEDRDAGMTRSLRGPRLRPKNGTHEGSRSHK